jgi:serine protein kinase
MDFVQRMQAHQAAEAATQWTGTFAAYVDLVRADPAIARSAHARIYDMIVAGGNTAFFTDSIFGVDDTLARLTEDYFHAAARRLDVRKRILLLMGPVSGGKSSIVTLLKRGLEHYTASDAGRLFGIVGCPMHEEPLKLFPEAIRADVERELQVHIEGQLCPVCRHRLQHECEGDIWRMPVERVVLSEGRRVGIGTFSPSDPKSQDIADLTGSIDFSTIMEIGSESDPRAYRFDGELNIANRGLMEFQEMLKCDEKFLWHLLSLTQEGNFKAGRFALISADMVVVAHTNEAEYRTFAANKKNEALLSRMLVMPIPYNLQVDAEERIYAKLVADSDVRGVHLAPYALRTTAMFSVLTRLKESDKVGVDLVQKLRAYNGEAVDAIAPHEVAELQRTSGEGMAGLDPRTIVNRIARALIEPGRTCVQAIDVLRTIKAGIDHDASLTPAERDRYLALLALARAEYDEVSKVEVQKSFIHAFEDSATSLFDNYIDQIEAYCQQQFHIDPFTGEQTGADERLMRAIEEQIGVTENAKQAFREELLIRISTYARQGRTFAYTSHPRLKEAIERKLFADMKDMIKITTSPTLHNEKQRKRMHEVTTRLIETQGYCEGCATELLRYVGGLLHR